MGAGLLLVALLAGGLSPRVGVADLQAGAGPSGDEAARRLYEAAVAARERLDSELASYTAVVRQRTGVGLRMPLKDRTLYRSESAHRVFWNRDGDVLVQVLALREQTPVGVEKGKIDLGVFSENFDPGNDALMFGMVPPDDEVYDEDRDDFWLAHPLDPAWRDRYTFTVGDTLSLALPDGRTIRAVELRVVPVEADVHFITGSLWIEPKSGSLVRAVYRLSDTFDAFRDIPDLQEEEDDDLKYVPGLLKPWTAEVQMIAVDYSLWDAKVWLPRSLHLEGVAAAGILKAPATVELTYDFESVVTEGDLAREADLDDSVAEQHYRTRAEAMQALARETTGDVPYRLSSRRSMRGPRDSEKTVRYLVPEDPAYLRDSPELPPPIGSTAPGFTSEDELKGLFDDLADLPAPPVQRMPATLRWGLQRPDLVRYNRVEGLSLGVRGQIRPQTPVGPLSVTATGRLGAADLHPDVRVDATHETLRRKFTWSAYHELSAVDEDARHLGPGNSVTALLFGRDDGDYYRRSGTSIEWTPPAADRRSWRVRGYAEYHQAAETNTDFALAHLGSSSWDFRDNVAAAEGWELGGVATLSPWWGTDPRSLQAGLELELRGAGGDWSYARASLVGRTALPLTERSRVGLAAGAGTSWGDPPPQRLWLMGGAATLRGYGPRARVGTSFGRGRAELARLFSFGAVSLFSDAAWAGDRGQIRWDDTLLSAGVGLSAVDGLIRIDAAWGLRDPKDFRLELYLDGIL